MRQVEKHVVKEEHDWFDYYNDITTLSRLLYNTAQFTQRQGYFYGWGTQTQASLDTLFKQNENYKAMPAKVAQLVLKQNADAWIAYYKALSAYKIDSSKFTGRPKPPNYVDDKNLVKFNNQAIGKREFSRGSIVPSMSPIRIPVKPGLKFGELCEVRIIPKTGCFVIEIDPNNKVRHLFSGRRVKRAWYVSKNGFKIHADVNAGYNIGRKSNPEGFDSLKFILRDKGCLVVHPRRITPLFRRVHAESRVA